jgi:hypothetical protein
MSSLVGQWSVKGTLFSPLFSKKRDFTVFFMSVNFVTFEHMQQKNCEAKSCSKQVGHVFTTRQSQKMQVFQEQ